jgi:hypothetical protein
VVGNHATSKYKSLDDAKLARSTIGLRPKENPPTAGTADMGKPG